MREADASGTPALVVGGGSNLLVADSGYPGTVVLVRTTGVAVEADTCGGAWVTVAAGESWDELVRRAVVEEWSGVEALSGIPGSVGATPIRTSGPTARRCPTSSRACAPGTGGTGPSGPSPRPSADSATAPAGSRRSPGVTSCWTQLPAPPVAELRADPVRRAGPVPWCLRRRPSASGPGRRGGAVAAVGKGMVLDAEDHDTWSAGSFFTNPVLDAAAAAALPAGAPRFDVGGGRVKTSAAWLIEHAGLRRGNGVGSAATVGQARPRVDQPRRGHGRGPPWPWRGMSVTASPSRAVSSSSPSRSRAAAPSTAPTELLHPRAQEVRFDPHARSSGGSSCQTSYAPSARSTSP